MEFEREFERIAQQYRDEGYTVAVHPKGDLLPPFATGLELDMIATRGEEKVVVAIKPRRSSLAADTQVERIAELVNRAPGWRLDLVVLEPGSAVQRVADKAQEPTGEQFERMLDRARQARGAGLNEMALTYAWAALEAAMRRHRDDAELYGRTTPAELLRILYGKGFLSKQEFDRARQAWAIRTQSVHGFVPPEIDPSLVDDMLALAKKVMGSEELQASSAG